MVVHSSDGLSLLVGDGLVSETFFALKGLEINRLQVNQQLVDTQAVSSHAWKVGCGTIDRRAVVECTALATDQVSALRVRELALSGAVGNFILNLTGVSNAQFGAYVTKYLELTQPGSIKRIQVQLESTGAIALG